MAILASLLTLLLEVNTGHKWKLWEPAISSLQAKHLDGDHDCKNTVTARTLRLLLV